MNVCNLPNASLIITTMKVHFAVIVSMHFCISVNEKRSFFNWEEHQFERRNMGQKRWSECLIYWWIRQMTRWCVMYSGDCLSILAHTYEWTTFFMNGLLFCMNGVSFFMNFFNVQLRYFLPAAVLIHAIFVMSIEWQLHSPFLL